MIVTRHHSFKFLLLVLACAISAYALGYYWIYNGSNDEFSAKFRTLNPLLVYAHFMGGGLALSLGALQLWNKTGSGLHRWLGRCYCCCVLVGAAGGIYLSFHSHLGIVTGLGFFILATLWLYTTGRALQCALTHQVDAHRRWILRSFALCCAAISLRILLPVLSLMFSFETSYILVAWLSWGINLILVEIYLYSSNRSTPFTTGNLAS